ncbi:hypothetical protein NKH77_15915 [Streptomyces sp. M19]
MSALVPHPDPPLVLSLSLSLSADAVADPPRSSVPESPMRQADTRTAVRRPHGGRDWNWNWNWNATSTIPFHTRRPSRT